MNKASIAKLYTLSGLSILALGFTSLSSQAESLLERSWGMNKAPGIEAPEAWKITPESKCAKSKVVVAVIDTGLDAKHPDLKKSLWVNKAEMNGKKGKDDDGNGLVDDIHGWDYARNTGTLTDGHGHGTHIAGIISANGNGKHAFKGVCPGVQIMPLRYYDKHASGVKNLQNTIKAIQYAVQKRVDIINYSGGGAEYSHEEFKALQEAEKKGILVVAAAGNEKSDADKRLYFPAAYPLKNILSVTAIDQSGRLLNLSNWGVKKVDVAAPGQSILSTLPGGSYGAMSGTSQATAYVSGIAALLLSERRSLSYSKLISLIEESSVFSKLLKKKAKTSSRVNAVAALKKLKSTKASSTIAQSGSKRRSSRLSALERARLRVLSGETELKKKSGKSSIWQKLD